MPKILSDTQRHYCTTNKALLAVVMAIELFRYYLTGRHFTVVTDHASLTWPRHFREPEGMVARRIARLQLFDFAIVLWPRKHHSHADGLSRQTSRLCKRETCPECKPLRKEGTSPVEIACCYTPTFLYQRHFDGYVEMSEEDAALFWEVDSHPVPSPEDGGVGPEWEERTVPVTAEAVPKEIAKTRPVPEDRPEDSQGTSVCNRPVSDSQDTKPADSARLARMQERLGAPVDNSVTPGPPRLQATTGTQTDETNQPRIKAGEESEAPEALKETVTPGSEQPVSNKTPLGGRRRADIETPIGMSLSSITPGLCYLSRKPPGGRLTE